MNSMNRTIAAILFAGLFAAGCLANSGNSSGSGDGSGGGGGSGNSTPTAGAAAAAVQDAITGMNIGFLGLINNKPSVASIEKARSADISESVYGYLDDLRAISDLSVSPFNDLSQDICTGGGSAVSAAGIDAATSNYKITVQFNNCLNLSQGATYNLTLEMVFPEIPPLPISAGLCNGMKVNTEANGTRSVSGVDFNNVVTYTGYQIDLTSNGCDLNGVPNNFFLNATGVLAYDDNLNAVNSFDLNGINLSVTASPVSGGSNLFFDGTFADTASCFDGSVSVDTTVPVLYASGFGTCPNSGILAVTGVVPGTVTYAAGGEVQVENGGEITTYDSCQEVVACQ
jgi:hypothetical protein